MRLTQHQVEAVQWFAATTGATVMPSEVPHWLSIVGDEAVDRYVRNCTELYNLSRSVPIEQKTA